MKLLLINGPNLNMLGIREKSIYGSMMYKDIMRGLKQYAFANGVKLTVYQSNSEGKIVDKIQKAYKRFDGIIINPAAYTHTSIAILDALKAVDIPTIEVHLSDVNNREEFRKTSYVSLYAKKTIVGKGKDGYYLAIDEFIKQSH